MSAKEKLILEVWKETGQESAGAAELDLIQKALLEHFGSQAPESPASIARTLADHGVRLQHPEILETDLHWREREILFSAGELNFSTLEAAVAWIEKVQLLQQQAGNELTEQLRKSVTQIRTELELVAASPRIRAEEREVAAEVAQWLVIWLQSPKIFADWLELRRRYSGTFPGSGANTQ